MKIRKIQIDSKNAPANYVQIEEFRKMKKIDVKRLTSAKQLLTRAKFLQKYLVSAERLKGQTMRRKKQ